MKIITDIFDMVILLAVLAIMLPFLLSSAYSVIKEESYGFSAKSDKSMQLIQGEKSHSSDDSMTAAEVLLMITISDNKRYVFPGGHDVVTDNYFNENIDFHINIIRPALDSTKKYDVIYDSPAGFWRVQLH